MDKGSLKKKVFIETYGCQMNFSDTEIVAAILQEQGYSICDELEVADVIFMNTCSIRDHAEQRIRKRLQELNALKKKRPFIKIGLLGCMAERLKTQLMEEEKVLDILVGPDAYRSLPDLLRKVYEEGQKACNVILSEEETYSEIEPVRLGSNGVSAFISIMRGCENFCAYCVVPYTRGKERSRDPKSILEEAKRLFEIGYRDLTLLGQNVNSYRWEDSYGFSQLMSDVAKIDPDLRLRFATSHPKDLSDQLLDVIAEHDNICMCIHLPVQSGSTRILEKMRRKYTREDYLERITAIKRKLPTCSITTDLIVGFCSETEADHQETLSLYQEVQYDYAFMFKYSERPNTLAAKSLKDDVPEEVKSRRLEEVIALQQKYSLQSNLRDVGTQSRVLVEGISKKSENQVYGRNSQNKVVVFDKENLAIGSYAEVRITSCTAATLLGERV